LDEFALGGLWCGSNEYFVCGGDNLLVMAIELWEQFISKHWVVL